MILKGSDYSMAKEPTFPLSPDAPAPCRPPWAEMDDLMRHYYDTEWGRPVTSESGLYERLTLEAFQAGLSWATVLRKRQAFRRAFLGFDPDAVARFGPADVTRLLSDATLIRNRRKIEATVRNARATIALRESGGLARLLWSFQPERTPLPRTPGDVPSRSPESEAMARTLKRAGFSFVGPTTCFALMEAVGIVDTNLVGTSGRGASGLWNGDGTRRARPLIV